MNFSVKIENFKYKNCITLYNDRKYLTLPKVGFNINGRESYTKIRGLSNQIRTLEEPAEANAVPDIQADFRIS